MNTLINEKIRDNRFFDFSINFDPAIKNKEVSIALKRHKFLFGCNGFGLINGILDNEFQNRYKKHFLEVFNCATLPFYWGQYEPVEGKTFKKELIEVARWGSLNGLTLKGHPLCWHTVCADWLLKYNTLDIYKKQMSRITREVEGFKGLINTWDVINEVVILPEFNRYDNAVSRLAKEYGALELTMDCFKKAKKSNPDSKLLIKDFNLSSEYEDLIEKLLDNGCPIDAIGLQTHQHQGYVGVEYIKDVLKRFGKFGLPLHFTEMTLLSGELAPLDLSDLNDATRDNWPSTTEGEKIQAEQISEIYSLLYADPLVESIVWWDMVDGNWLNAPSGLLRRDYTPKPGFKKLRNLICNDWGFSSRNILVNSKGQIDIQGPEGLYALVVDGKEIEINLSKDKKSYSLSY